jgi:uncharacterized phage protein (TIGR01671 family)
MNDRFKFRVWDNSHNQYYDISKYNVVPCLTTLGLKWYDKGYGMLSTDLELWGESQENRFIIEQCTGLKDKNSKLVFEGDLVKTKSGVYGIMWLKGTFNAVGLLEGAYLTTNINNIADGEIIGNIHENRDLLVRKD